MYRINVTTGLVHAVESRKNQGIQFANVRTGTGMSFLYQIERFSYDIEMKKHEQNRNNERTEIERFDWFIEQIQTRVAFGWLSVCSG